MQSDGTYKGFLSVNFNGTPGGSQGASCGSDNDWSWPVIDQISVLGVGAVNGDTITVQVRQTPCQKALHNYCSYLAGHFGCCTALIM